MIDGQVDHYIHMTGKLGIFPYDLASYHIGRDECEIFMADRLVMEGNPTLSERSKEAELRYIPAHPIGNRYENGLIPLY